jgi:hypothetical protein
MAYSARLLVALTVRVTGKNVEGSGGGHTSEKLRKKNSLGEECVLTPAIVYASR